MGNKRVLGIKKVLLLDISTDATSIFPPSGSSLACSLARSFLLHSTSALLNTTQRIDLVDGEDSGMCYYADSVGWSTLRRVLDEGLGGRGQAWARFYNGLATGHDELPLPAYVLYPHLHYSPLPPASAQGDPSPLPSSPSVPLAPSTYSTHGPAINSAHFASPTSPRNA
ncbi:hypothetical protein BDQ17DRAFT_1102556 [Cyathus striatus]|nr:hypothetical protein BDQ17DRAFT_1102556 [Cyathus striatus]